MSTTNSNTTISITRQDLVAALEQLRLNRSYVDERASKVSSKSRPRAWRRAAADVLWMGLTSNQVDTTTV